MSPRSKPQKRRRAPKGRSIQDPEDNLDLAAAERGNPMRVTKTKSSEKSQRRENRKVQGTKQNFTPSQYRKLVRLYSLTNGPWKDLKAIIDLSASSKEGANRFGKFESPGVR